MKSRQRSGGSGSGRMSGLKVAGWIILDALQAAASTSWRWILRVCMLDAAAPSRVWRWVHVGILILSIALATAGAILRRIAWHSAEGLLITRIAPAFIGAAIALVLTERLISLLYGRPIPPGVLRRSLFARRPFVAFFMATVLSLASLLSPEAMIVMHARDLSAVIRYSLIALLVVNTVPLWVLLLHPLAIARAARALRGKKASSVASRLAALAKDVASTLALPVQAIRDIVRVLRARRA